MSVLGIQLAMTGLSAISSIQQGRAARKQAAFNQAQYEQSARQTEIEALERANVRLRQFETATSSNIAFQAFLGRDPSDRSMKAFMDRQKEIAYSDVQSIGSQGMMQASQQRSMAGMEASKGRAALMQGYLGAGSAIASGFWRYEMYKTDKLKLGTE